MVFSKTFLTYIRNNVQLTYSYLMKAFILMTTQYFYIEKYISRQVNNSIHCTHISRRAKFNRKRCQLIGIMRQFLVRLSYIFIMCHSQHVTCLQYRISLISYQQAYHRIRLICKLFERFIIWIQMKKETNYLTYFSYLYLLYRRRSHV